VRTKDSKLIKEIVIYKIIIRVSKLQIIQDVKTYETEDKDYDS
jgi:hypothetical protein